jgi:hypothetical protein
MTQIFSTDCCGKMTRHLHFKEGLHRATSRRANLGDNERHPSRIIRYCYRPATKVAFVDKRLTASTDTI